ncbi:hypothetical protein [Aquimarina sp. I32.4]|uniref:hypothetical protein n=1 Tax=Aquimarina sp. I32.4 TaxID=2053903 RepID=UPI000CDF0E78|nr:hypothetical protein [Aquimarina sp. I32.4]
MRYIIIIIISITSLGCKGQNKTLKETPLMSVIKLQAAEAVLNFEEAKKYIDLDKVFEKFPESHDVEKQWKEMITVLHNLGNNKKFTNQFKYFNYTITENVNNSKAKVSFVAIDKGSKIKEISYSLYEIDNKWKVFDIQYVN